MENAVEMNNTPENLAGPSVDIQQLLAKIGEDTIIKQMMAADIQRLMAENSALRERLATLEGEPSETGNPK